MFPGFGYPLQYLNDKKENQKICYEHVIFITHLIVMQSTVLVQLKFGCRKNFFKFEFQCPSPHNLLLTGSKERKFWAFNFFFIFKKLSLPNTLFFESKHKPVFPDLEISSSFSGHAGKKNNLFKGETNLFFFFQITQDATKRQKIG